jgi:membrane protease YdiL (CAAX protease family)
MLKNIFKRENTTRTTTKDKVKGVGASAIWGLLFIGGMCFGSLALMILGILLNWDFVIDGMYAFTDFYAAIGTSSFGEAAMALANEAAVLIHTSMCVGYLPVIIAMIIRRKESGGFNKIYTSEIPDVFKWLSLSMAASFVLDLMVQACAQIPYFAKQASDLASVGILSTAGMPWLALLTTGILAPIVEEIAFRRGIQKSMTEKFNPVVGITVSALVFGVMHGNLFQGIFATLMGIVLGYVYHKTGNLWYTTIIHIVNNSACVLITLLGLNGTLVSLAIPVVAGVLYLVTSKIQAGATVEEAVAYIKAENTPEVV